MDIEELLRERLGAASAQPRPSLEFEEQVRRRLPPRRSGRRHFSARAAESLIGLAAAVAVLAVAVPLLVAPRSALTGPVATTTHAAVVPAGTPHVTPSPTATPVPQIHADRWFLSFDYPATWTLNDRNIFTASHGLSSGSVAEGRVFGFVGNGAATQQCANNACTTEWSLTENSVVMRFEAVPRIGAGAGGALDTIWTSRQANRGTTLPGATELVVDHLPARVTTSPTDAIPYSKETAPGANEVLWFGIPSQTIPGFGWVIVAAIRGPNVAGLEAETRGVVESIRFQQPVKLLPTVATELEQTRTQALERYFDEEASTANDEHVHSWECFPRTVGASRESTITQNPFTNPLTRPLPVTCTVESMEPNAMQGWTIVLSETWQAGADYPAGSARWYVTTAGDGRPQEGGLLGDDQNPADYPHQGTSKYPG